MRAIIVGAWRDDSTGPMQVVSGAVGRERVHFAAPAAARLPDEVRAFLAWFDAESEIDPLSKAALAHLWFVTIHPFDDGNGRIARAIADMALARSEGSPQRFYSISTQIRAERTRTTTSPSKRSGDLSMSRPGWNGSSDVSAVSSPARRELLVAFSVEPSCGSGSTTLH
jgi:Fic family protein